MTHAKPGLLTADLSRLATTEEMRADAHTLTRSMELFPEADAIMRLSPYAARESIAGWVPFLEAAMTHCQTLNGLNALQITTTALIGLEEAHDQRSIRERICAAFFQVEEAASQLRQGAKEMAPA